MEESSPFLSAFVSDLASPKKKDLAAGNFTDECFVIGIGARGWPLPEQSGPHVTDTALWGYKEIRKRHTYWLNKKLLLSRIFRSTNLSLWQKGKRPGTDGLGAELLVAIVSARTLWIGAVGKFKVLLYRDTLIDDLLNFPAHTQSKILGGSRLGITPSIKTEAILPGDSILLTTDALLESLEEETVRSILADSENSAASLKGAARQLVHAARENGAIESLGVWLVKRVK